MRPLFSPAFAALFSLIFAATAAADSLPGYQSSSAQQTVGQESNLVVCAWTLPDIDSSLSGFQYGQDDDSVSRPATACEQGDGRPNMADGAQSVIQVAPNPEDSPGARRLQSWAAVASPSGTADTVAWKVFYPDGTLMTEIRGERVSPSNLAGLGASDRTGTMWNAAYETGQLASDAIHSTGSGLNDLAAEREVELWHSEWEVSAGQICGLYTVEVTAVAGAESSTFTTTVDIQCFFNLQIDVPRVLWSTVGPVAVKTIPGDLRFINDGSSPATTSRITGTTAAQFGIEFSQMYEVDQFGAAVENGTILDQFGVAFGFERSDMQWFNPIDAGHRQWIDREDFRCMQDEVISRVDLSVIGHPTESGIFGGNITFWIRQDRECLFR